MHEEAYLALVTKTLHDKINETDRKMTGNENDIAQMHEYFWENYNEFDEYGYELYDNSNALKSRVREQEEYKKDRRRYEKMLDSPYFGRVRAKPNRSIITSGLRTFPRGGQRIRMYLTGAPRSAACFTSTTRVRRSFLRRRV